MGKNADRKTQPFKGLQEEADAYDIVSVVILNGGAQSPCARSSSPTCLEIGKNLVQTVKDAKLTILMGAIDEIMALRCPVSKVGIEVAKPSTEKVSKDETKPSTDPVFAVTHDCSNNFLVHTVRCEGND